MATDGTQSLTQHEAEWFEKLGKLVTAGKLDFAKRQENQAKERYAQIKKLVEKIRSDYKDDAKAYVDEYEHINTELERALEKNDGQAAKTWKTQLRILLGQIELYDKALAGIRSANNACDQALEQLQAYSPSKATEGDEARREILTNLGKIKAKKVVDCQSAADEIRKVIDKAYQLGSTARQLEKQFNQQIAKTFRELNSAKAILRVETSQALLDKYHAVSSAIEVEKDLIKGMQLLLKLQEDIPTEARKQHTLASEYENEKKAADNLLKDLRDKLSPTDYAEFFRKYGEAANLARVNNYAEAKEAMANLKIAMAESLDSAEKRFDQWITDRFELGDQLGKAIDKYKEKKKEGSEETWATAWTEYWDAVLKGDVEYYCWLGDHLKDYDNAKKRLEDLVTSQLPAIQKEFEEKDTQVQEAAKTAAPFVKRCNEIERQINEVILKIGGDEATAKEALGTISDDFAKARDLPKSSTQRGGWKLGEELTKAIEEASEDLNKLESGLSELLEEGNSNGEAMLKELVSLRDMVAQRKLAEAEHKVLEEKWHTARDLAETALDELAQLGGDNYLKLLGEFEGFEETAAGANTSFRQYLSLFPDEKKVAEGAKTKQNSIKDYATATDGVGNAFVDRINNEKIEIAKSLETARKELKRIKGDLDLFLFEDKWLKFGNSASGDFRTTIREEGDRLGAFAESDNVGAIKNAISRLLELHKKMRGLDSGPDLEEFKKLVAKIKEMTEQIESDDFKSCMPTVQAKLAEQLEKDVSVRARSVWHTEGMEMVLAFEKDVLTPALHQVARIKKVRDDLPDKKKSISDKLLELVKKMNQLPEVTDKFPVEPVNCGDLSKQFAGLVKVIEENETAGVVEGGFLKLEELEKQIAELAGKEPDDLKGLAATAGQQVKDQLKSEQEYAERKDKVLKAIETFMSSDFAIVKKSGDKEKTKMIEALAESAKEAAEGNQVMTAEEHLHSMRQAAADLLPGGEEKKTTKVTPLGEQWKDKLSTVNSQVKTLKETVKKAWTEDLEADQSVVAKVIDKLPETLDLEAGVFATELETIDNAELPIAIRKAAREKALKQLRLYKAAMAGNPVYKHLRDNQFDTPVATAGLLQHLATMETKVLTTM